MSIKVLCAHVIFNEYAFILSQRFGCEVERDFKPQAGDLYLVLGAHEVAPTLYLTQKNANNSFGYIIYNSEQINSSHWRNKYYINLCRDNPTYHYSNYLAQEIKEKYKIVPYSFFFFDFLSFDKSALDIKEQYDIVFLGARSPEREAIHQQLVSAYPDKKILFDFDYSYKNPQELTSLLSGTKVVLNIPFYKDSPLETHRINKAISCGCKVVSMISKDLDATEFYKDYIYFTKDMIGCLGDEKFLETPKKTYEDLTKELAPMMTTHNIYTAKQIHNKLLDKVKKI